MLRLISCLVHRSRKKLNHVEWLLQAFGMPSNAMPSSFMKDNWISGSIGSGRFTQADCVRADLQADRLMLW